MKNIILLILILFFLGCKTTFKPYSTYSPNTLMIGGEETRIKTVRINFVIIQNEEGEGNFSEKNPFHMKYLNDMEEEVNRIYSKLKQFTPEDKCYDSLQYADLGVRVRLENIYFVRHPKFWDNTNENNHFGCSEPFDTWYLKELHQNIKDTTDPNIINLYFTTNSCIYKERVLGEETCKQKLKDHQTWCSRAASKDMTKEIMIHIRNLYLKYHYMENEVVNNPQFESPDWDKVYSWLLKGEGSGMAHELAHPFFLAGFHWSECHHLMNGKKPNNPAYFSPRQVEEIHKNLNSSCMFKYLVK